MSDMNRRVVCAWETGLVELSELKTRGDDSIIYICRIFACISISLSYLPSLAIRHNIHSPSFALKPARMMFVLD